MTSRDNEFAPDERLFRRLNPRWWNGPFINGSQVPVHLVQFPRCSVNREKYSEPEDVLKPSYDTFGIGAFEVQDVPSRLEHSATGAAFTFGVEHEPEPANYAHSELRSYNESGANKEPAPLVKKLFRVLLRRKLKILKMPDLR